MYSKLLRIGFTLLASFLLVFKVEAQQERLIFAIDLIRHGDRTSIIPLPKAPHVWQEGEGQLTAEGMQQAFRLGATFRERYIVRNKLLPETFNAANVYVRSTDIDRTLMTAESVLMGLYPLGSGKTLPNGVPALPERYQPIPVHTVDNDQDELFNVRVTPDMVRLYVASREDWKQKTAALTPKFARWSELTGFKIDSLPSLIYVADTLHVFQLHNIPLPEGLTAEDAKEIIEGGDWSFTTMFKPREVGDKVGHKLLSEIISNLQHGTMPDSTVKYILYSAHDGNLLSVMSAMHVPMNNVPTYAGDVNFSLYEVGTKNYVVKISYNNEPVYLPECGGRDCTLREFAKLGVNRRQHGK